MTSKPKIIGEQILKRINLHDQDQGGVFTMVTGCQGSGKTSVLLSLKDYTQNFHPDEKIFWSECYNAPLQIFKSKKKDYCFLALKDTKITFRDRNNKLKPIDIPFTYFTDFDDLYNKAETQKTNVVFFGDRLRWMDFIMYLRSIGEWNHVFIDEFAEICPAYLSGEMWKKVGMFSNNILKDIRKCFINLHTNTQMVQNIDDRARKQVMINIFLPGARVPKYSRIQQGAIDNLVTDRKNGNEAYLEYSGRFGTTVFRDIYKPDPRLNIDVINNGEGGKYNFIPSFNSA